MWEKNRVRVVEMYRLACGLCVCVCIFWGVCDSQRSCRHVHKLGETGKRDTESTGRSATNKSKRTQAVSLPANPLMKICGSG